MKTIKFIRRTNIKENNIITKKGFIITSALFVLMFAFILSFAGCSDTSEQSRNESVENIIYESIAVSPNYSEGESFEEESLYDESDILDEDEEFDESFEEENSEELNEEESLSIEAAESIDTTESSTSNNESKTKEEIEESKTGETNSASKTESTNSESSSSETEDESKNEDCSNNNSIVSGDANSNYEVTNSSTPENSTQENFDVSEEESEKEENNEVSKETTKEEEKGKVDESKVETEVSKENETSKENENKEENNPPKEEEKDTEGKKNTIKLVKHFPNNIKDFLCAPTAEDFGNYTENAIALYNAIISNKDEIVLTFDGASWEIFRATFEEMVLLNLIDLSVETIVVENGAILVALNPQNTVEMYKPEIFKLYYEANISAGLYDEMGEREAVTAINNWICGHLSYQAQAKNHLEAMQGKNANCDAYAQIFEYMCDNAGIECKWVVGMERRHAWNVVNVNGVYYYIDVCWNDSDRPNRYFLSETLWENHINCSIGNKQSNVFAVFSADDSSLTFYNNSDKVNVGEQYNGKIITAVFKGVDSFYAFEPTDVPWHEYRFAIKKVEVKDVISPISMSYWFYCFNDCESFILGKIDTKKLTAMDSMFLDAGYNAASFYLDASNWDTSNVININNMFYNAGYNAKTFTVNLSGWNLSSITEASHMFYEAGRNAETFIADLSGWNTSSITHMNEMFCHAGRESKTFRVDVSGWDISSVENMRSMFGYTGTNANEYVIEGFQNWDLSTVKNKILMFQKSGK